MIPDFLEQFKAAIQKHQLEAIKIEATPLAANEVLSLTQSKFLGKPFLPIDIDYPKDKKRIPMILLAQINFEETPEIEHYPTKGILQLFVSSTEWYNMDDYKILFHKNLTKETHLTFLF